MEDYTYQVAPKSRFRLSRPVKIGIAIALGLIGIVILFTLLNPSNIKRAGNLSGDFVSEFITKPNATKAYNLTNVGFKSSMSLDNFKANSSYLNKLFTKPLKETGNRPYIYPDSWQIDYTGESKVGKYDFTTIVTKEGKNYRVQYYEYTRQ